MNSIGLHRTKEFAIIFSMMDAILNTAQASTFDDDLLLTQVMRQLKGRVNPNLVREAIAFAQDRLKEEPKPKDDPRTPQGHPDWFGSQPEPRSPGRPKAAHRPNWGDLN
jgi:hypothetical protein